jgi:hypothetical protein
MKGLENLTINIDDNNGLIGLGNTSDNYNVYKMTNPAITNTSPN